MSVTTNYLISGVPSGSGGTIDDYYDASGTTYTLSPSELAVKTTNVSGCALTIPTGVSSGTTWAIVKNPGAGAVSIDRVASAGVTIYPTGTLQIASDGDVMCVTSLGSDTFVVTGYNQSGPRFLGYFADWPAVIAAYPVGGAAIAALNHGDFLICTGGGVVAGLSFTPNSAKTRLIAADGRRINLAMMAGIVGTPIGTVGTGVTSGQFSDATTALPAYLAQAGDIFEIWAVARKVGTAAGATLKVRIGTAGLAASDQGVGELGFSTTTNDDGSVDTKVTLISNTSAFSAQRITHNTRFNGSTVNNPNGGTLNFAAAQSITLDMETINSADSCQLLQLEIVLVQKP